jgi:DNA-binding response OmpR family regulator
MRIRRLGCVMTDASLVLVVEDDVTVREVVASALQAHGFSVVRAGRGAAAIALIDQRRQALKALVTDIRLGGEVSGWDVAAHARRLIPDLPVVYISGADFADWTMKGVRSSVAVAKPFAPSRIVAAVTTLMSGGWD